MDVYDPECDSMASGKVNYLRKDLFPSLVKDGKKQRYATNFEDNQIIICENDRLWEDGMGK